MNGVSHVAIGVRDRTNRSSSTAMSSASKSASMRPSPSARCPALRRPRGRAAPSIYTTAAVLRRIPVLSEMPGARPTMRSLDEVVISHFSWWVDDTINKRSPAAGADPVAPTPADSGGYGEKPGKKFLTCPL